MQQAVDEIPMSESWKLPFEGADGFNKTFDAWFRQMGYPIIHVASSNGETKLEQSRFLQYGQGLKILTFRQITIFMGNPIINF